MATGAATGRRNRVRRRGDKARPPASRAPPRSGGCCRGSAPDPIELPPRLGVVGRRFPLQEFELALGDEGRLPLHPGPALGETPRIEDRGERRALPDEVILSERFGGGRRDRPAAARLLDPGRGEGERDPRARHEEHDLGRMGRAAMVAHGSRAIVRSRPRDRRGSRPNAPVQMEGRRSRDSREATSRLEGSSPSQPPMPSGEGRVVARRSEARNAGLDERGDEAATLAHPVLALEEDVVVLAVSLRLA